MGSTGIAASFAFIAGLGGAVQIAVQGRLGDRIGSIEALTAPCSWRRNGTRRPPRRSPEPRRPPRGIHGPEVDAPRRRHERRDRPRDHGRRTRIGIVATTAFLIVGQFTLATVIDRFGWFGVQAVPLAWPRVLGLALLAAGAALTLKR